MAGYITKKEAGRQSSNKRIKSAGAGQACVLAPGAVGVVVAVLKNYGFVWVVTCQRFVAAATTCVCFRGE